MKDLKCWARELEISAFGNWRIVSRRGTQSDLCLRVICGSRFGGMSWTRRGQAEWPVKRTRHSPGRRSQA